MTRLLKLMLSAVFALILVLAAVAGALAWWLSGDGPRAQVQALASERLGVPVTLGALSLDVFPWPSLSVSDVRIATQAPLSAQRMALRPAWRKLVGLGGAPRELEISSLHLRGLRLPQKGVDQITDLLSKTERSEQSSRRQSAQNASNNETQPPPAPPVIVGLLAIPQQTQLDDVVWQSAAGETLALSGEVSLNGTRDQMEVNLTLAGGSVRGPLRLTSKNGKSNWQLRGELAISAIDLAQLPGARQRLAGRLNGTTTLDAHAAQLASLGTALQTITAFNVGGAVIKGVDLAKAVRTLGLSRGGETALQQLSGSVATRGTGAPMQITLSDLQASSSLLKASGAVSVGAAASSGGPRPLSGKVSVDLNAPDGGTGAGKALGVLVGIPLEIGGTTAAPTVAPTKGAMIGGTIGSVMAPVIGTGAGAKMGDKVGEKLSGWKEKLFGK